METNLFDKYAYYCNFFIEIPFEDTYQTDMVEDRTSGDKSLIDLTDQQSSVFTPLIHSTEEYNHESITSIVRIISQDDDSVQPISDPNDSKDEGK